MRFAIFNEAYSFSITMLKRIDDNSRRIPGAVYLFPVTKLRMNTIRYTAPGVATKNARPNPGGLYLLDVCSEITICLLKK